MQIEEFLMNLGLSEYTHRFNQLNTIDFDCSWITYFKRITIDSLISLCKLLVDNINKKKFKKKMKKLQRNIGFTKLQAKMLFRGICAVIGELKKMQISQDTSSNVEDPTPSNLNSINEERALEDNSSQESSNEEEPCDNLQSPSKVFIDKDSKNSVINEVKDEPNSNISMNISTDIKQESESDDSDNDELELIISDIKENLCGYQSNNCKLEPNKAKLYSSNLQNALFEIGKESDSAKDSEKIAIKRNIRSESRLREKLQKLCTQMENAVRGNMLRKRGRPTQTYNYEIDNYHRKVSDLQLDLSYKSEQINKQILNEISLSKFTKKLQETNPVIKQEVPECKTKQLASLSLRERMKQNSEIAKRSIITLEIMEDEERLRRQRYQQTYNKYCTMRKDALYDNLYDQLKQKEDDSIICLDQPNTFPTQSNPIKDEDYYDLEYNSKLSKEKSENMKILKELGLVCKRGRTRIHHQ